MGGPPYIIKQIYLIQQTHSIEIRYKSKDNILYFIFTI